MGELLATKCKNCGNRVWEVMPWDNIAECSNCGNPRPYYTRKPRKGITPSQQKWIDKIRAYYAGLPREKVTEFEIKEFKYFVSVTVITDGGIFTNHGGHFFIGRRGKFEMKGSYAVCTNDKARKTHQWLIAHEIRGTRIPRK